MKTIVILTRLTVVLICFCPFFLSSCEQNTKNKHTINDNIVFKDYGNEPAVLNIESYTVKNENFRTTLWTGKNLQVTLMTIPVGGEVGLEMHTEIDQFLRIEEGEAKVMMGDAKDSLYFTQEASDDFAVMVPAGKWHNLVNIGDKPLKLYSIYAPAEHPYGTIHKTSKEAIEAEHHH